MKKILQKMKKNNLICIGSVGKPRGLKGEFFLNSFCSPQKNIINYTKMIETNDGVCLELEYIKENNLKFLSKIKNINNVDEIKTYTNLMLYISSENLPSLNSDEVYWHDLVGMLVIDENKNELLGEVKDINNFGANECLVVHATDDSIDNKERLIPFIRNNFISQIDKEKRIITVNWQSDY
tara:strand:- start:764 stop:1306 length:543 start_codon:yes stop_codon:yes gene_type:complete